MTEPTKCDFCGSANVHWAFPCRDHPRPGTHVAALVQHADSSLEIRSANISGWQHGPWAACTPCKHLIVRGRRDHLVKRSVTRALRKTTLPIDAASYAVHVREVHDAFWANREGPPVPVTPDWRPSQ